MANKATEGSGNSSYATGGGGVTLEQTFGGVLLTSLLLGVPTPGLGEGEAVERIALQASGTSPVDDFVVHGTERRISFGVRRDPTIAGGDTKFIKLLVDYLRIVINHAAEVDSDKWRLGLVVAGPHTGAAETRVLADFARAHATAASFRAEILRNGATTADVRTRLKYVDDAIAKALEHGNLQTPANQKDTLAWRFLRALHVVVSRLEGDDAEDRTHAIALLVGATRGSAEAEQLFYDLCRLTGRLATRGGVIDEQTLRRELRGIAEIGRAATHAKAWTVFDTCSELLESRTATALADPSAPARPLTIERAELRSTLSGALRKSGEEGTCVVVSGEPDVGKSVLTLVEAGTLKRTGASIISLSLRDLPPTPLALDQHLGAPAERVFGAMSVAPIRMLVLDGAEVVLEGRSDLVSYILRAAQRAGIGIALTTRDDAKEALVQAAKRAGFNVQQLPVPPLRDNEIDQVAASFPVLARVAAEPRSRWLLARPGMVELLLQSGAHAALPDGALSEADVFAAVWRFLVRLDEVVAPNVATPDGRDTALVDVVRKMLQPATTIVNADALAISSLRRDRILLPLGPTAAWQTGEVFATDLYRDLATARLLVVDDLQSTIANANAPRWLVRAARLAAQVRLLCAGDNQENTRQALQAAFDQLAQTHGDRWRDLVWEALLALGTSRDVLKAASQQLLGNDGMDLGDLLRVVLQKFCHDQQADVAIVAPVVEFICNQRMAIAALNRDLRDEVQKVATYWLAGRGFGDRSTTSDPLRVRVRDELLRNARDESEFRVYGLSLLGPDLDQSGMNELQAVEPHMLKPSVEDVYSRRIMARHHPTLLLELAERYYIELPDPDQPPYGSTFLNEGVRRHDYTGGFDSSDAAFYFGPFWVLLNSRAALATVSFIKRLLDHATRVRLTRGSRNAASISSMQLPGFEMDLPRLGPRRFIGDAHVWRWHRATSVGPYACMSALLALERAVDQQLAEPGVSLADVLDPLLRDAESLAIPGLVVGILARYIDRVTNELDSWLTNPLIWQLDDERAISEFHGARHARDSDIEDAHGHERRNWMVHHIVGWLVEDRYNRGDTNRLEVLAGLGRNLVANASAMVAGALDPAVTSETLRAEEELDADSIDEPASEGPDDEEESDTPNSGTTETDDNEPAISEPSIDTYVADEEITVGDLADPEADACAAREFLLRVRWWGAMFDVANYQKTPKDNGVELAFVAPAEIQEEFAPRRLDHQRGQSAWWVVAKYSMRHDDGPAPADTLRTDIAFVRDLEANPPEMGPPQDMRASAAVASAAIEAMSSGSLTFPLDDIAWALDTVIRAASPSSGDALESTRSTFSWGPNRLAARSIAQVLAMPHTVVPDDRYARTLIAARELANSRIDEVRVVFADSLRKYWRTPCRTVGGRCGHALVLAAFRDAVKSCRFEVDKYTGPRMGDPVDDPTTQLSSIPAYALILECLLAPIIATTDCATAKNCARDAAVDLRVSLLDAHRRTVVDNAKRDWNISDSAGVLAVPRALLAIDDGELDKHSTHLIDQARALDSLLRGLATVATVDRDMRAALARVWPGLMDLLLGLVGSGHDVREARYSGRRAFAALVPRPDPPRGANNIDALMQAAADGWPSLISIASQVQRWLPLAAGYPESVDALVGFLETQPTTVQLQPGLEWIMALVGADFAGIANRSHFLPAWLERIREPALHDPTSTKIYQRLIDGLAAMSDGAARRLQMTLE